jgi:pSer/pThr/pTyr-binding forkhead associated (FHA) protein
MEEITKEPSSIRIFLYIIQDGRKELIQEMEINKNQKYTVGRSKKEADIALNDKLLSRKHAELVYYDNKTIMVKDLDSRNGTYLNKERISPLKETFFNMKDILSFGSLDNELVFYEGNERIQDVRPYDSDKNRNNINEEKYQENNEDINSRKSYSKMTNNDKDINEEYYKRNERSLYGKRDGANEDDGLRRYDRINNPIRNNFMDNNMNKERNMTETYGDRDREINADKSMSIRETYNKYNDRNNEYNYPSKYKKSINSSYKSRSRSRGREEELHSISRKAFYHHSHFGSKSNNSNLPMERYREREYRNYDNYNRSKRYMDREDSYRQKESDRLKEEMDEKYKRSPLMNSVSYDENNYIRMKGENYDSQGNKLSLNLDTFDIRFPRHEDGRDIGFIKCQVSGYLALNIRNKRLLDLINRKNNGYT